MTHLTLVPWDLYLDHVKKQGLPEGIVRLGATCMCDETAPDRTCDVGEALFRARAKDFLRKGIA